MTNVLVVASAPPAQPAVLLETLQRFRDRGATVSVACFFDAEELPVDPALAEVHAFPVAAESIDARFRKAVSLAPPPRRIWLHARRSAWVRERARRTDLFVAIDPKSVHTVWELAQRQPRADAFYGLAPAVKAVELRIAGGGPSALTRLRRRVASTASIGVRGARRFGIRSAKSATRRATSPAVMRTWAGARLWSAAVAVPGVPDRVRSKLAYHVHTGLVRAERPQVAARATAAALRRISSVQRQANLLTSQASAELRLGRTPIGLTAAVTAQLGLADKLMKKDPAKAAAALAKATTLISSRVLHFDGLSSPLAEAPDKFLAPFHRSAAAQRLAAPRGRARPAAPRPTDRPLRLLFVTLINDNFLTEIRDRYAALPGVEVRTLDLHADEARRWLIRGGEAVMAHVLSGGSPYGHDVEQWLRPHLDWADTVFIDWCQAQAALFTLVDPGSTRIIVRLHSFEAFNFWPHVIDFSRVDDLVFVSDHLRDLTVAAHPRLVGDQAPRLSVISNAMDLRRFQRGDKPASARFTLGLVGISAVAKDPRWAIDVLRHLREQDPRYRLLLIGSELNPKVSVAARRYHQLLEQDLAELEPTGAVVRVGQTDDVPAALADVGVILSSSVRESFHCALVEGAASGAVPVVRDWPFFAGKEHGARTLFPADWVVDTPEEAAKRILTTTASEQIWRDEGRAAAAHAADSWDWTVTCRQFDQLLLGAPVED